MRSAAAFRNVSDVDAILCEQLELTAAVGRDVELADRAGVQQAPPLPHAGAHADPRLELAVEQQQRRRAAAASELLDDERDVVGLRRKKRSRSCEGAEL